MSASRHKPRLAVVSPFLDKSHGTERIVIEWITRLASDFEIHVYSQHVEDLDPSQIRWHRIPRLPGPHLFNFLWWLGANRLWRAWDRRFRGRRHDLVYSPGPNCLDADVMSVHIVFAQYAQESERHTHLMRNPVWTWPRRLHRGLYYKLAIWLESRAYTRPDVPLILIAQRTAAELEQFYGRRDQCVVLHLGLDHAAFNPERRRILRPEARKSLGLPDDRFALLLVGNDWRNKGVPVLLDALTRLRDLSIELLVASRENPAAIRTLVAEEALDGRVHVLPPRKDVEFYYAAADAYAGPSLGDTFALPPAEAMACGLPVIVSSANGTSEIMTHGVDGLILDDPRDAVGLAAMIRRLYEDEEFRDRLGERAAETSRQYTWERNARELAAIFGRVLQRKSGFAAQTVAQEP